MFGYKGLNHMFLFTIQFSASENERRKGNLGTLCRSCKYNVLCACIVHLHWVMVILLLLKKLKTVRGQKLILVRIFFSVSCVVYYDEYIYLQGGLHCKYQGICNSQKQIKLLLEILGWSSSAVSWFWWGPEILFVVYLIFESLPRICLLQERWIQHMGVICS